MRQSESKSHAGIPVSHVADAFKGCLALVIVSGRGVRLLKVTGTFGNIRVAFRRPRFPIFVLHHRGMWDVVGGPNMNRHEAVEGCINGCTRALGFEVSAARRAFVSTFMEFSQDCHGPKGPDSRITQKYRRQQFPCPAPVKPRAIPTCCASVFGVPIGCLLKQVNPQACCTQVHRFKQSSEATTLAALILCASRGHARTCSSLQQYDPRTTGRRRTG